MVKIELSIDQINIVLTGLGELQAKVSYPVIHEIHKQANPQIVKELDEKKNDEKLS